MTGSTPPAGATLLRYQNWHGNQAPRDVAWFSPRDAADVFAAIKHCSTAGARLLTIGQAFSLSRLVEADGHVLDPQRIRAIAPLPDACVKQPSSDRRYFLVGGGAFLTDVNHQLALDGTGWALPTSGAASNQSVAGATSTGTHGAADYGAVHDCIRAVCLLIAPDTAVLLQASPHAFTDNLVTEVERSVGATVKLVDDDLAFRAAVVGLGAMGFIHSIVIEAEPLYELVGSWVDRPFDDAGIWNAIRTNDFKNVWVRPPQAGSGRPFNIAVTFSPYAIDDPSVNGAFASFLWKIKPTRAYPANYPQAHPRMGSSLERWAAGISPHLPSGITAALVAGHFHDGEWHPSTPAFPGHVFGPTTIRPGNGRSTEIMVPVEHAFDAVRAVTNAIARHPKRLVGLVGIRYVGATKHALLAMNQRDVVCIEVPCLNVSPSDTQAVFDSCWRAVKALGHPHTFHWGQENPHTQQTVSAYFGDGATQWRQARERLLPETSRVVFRNPLTDAVGLTHPPPSPTLLAPPMPPATPPEPINVIVSGARMRTMAATENRDVRQWPAPWLDPEIELIGGIPEFLTGNQLTVFVEFALRRRFSSGQIVGLFIEWTMEDARAAPVPLRTWTRLDEVLRPESSVIIQLDTFAYRPEIAPKRHIVEAGVAVQWGTVSWKRIITLP